MWRVAAGHVFTRMATEAVRCSSFEYIIQMARGAGQCSVHAGESKSCVFRMIEAGPEPTIQVVTALAGCWKARADVVDHGGLEVLLVAGIAGCRESHELPGGCVLVTLLALNQRVSAD